MISEIRKSINSVLYERTTSPLFGSFLISWSIWNWKIIYLTLFISEERLVKNNSAVTKIEYIEANYLNNYELIFYPLISTVVFVCIVPFLSNGAYWLSLKFNKWRIDKRNSVEQKQLLTLEQSSALRNELLVTEKKSQELIEAKEIEIKSLKMIIDEHNRNKTLTNVQPDAVDTASGAATVADPEADQDLFFRISNVWLDNNGVPQNANFNLSIIK